MTSIAEQFNAMGTSVDGAIVAPVDAAEHLWQMIKERVKETENRFSRFKKSSELTKLNQAAGQPFKVSAEMIEMLQAARWAFEHSGGLVDATIGQSIIDAGYDRSFEELENATPKKTTTDNTVRQHTMADVTIDVVNRQVTVPLGTRLDFGGIAKGLLADQLAMLIDAVTTNYWLSIGGDMMISGTDDHGQPWHIGVQDPFHLDRDVATLTLPPGRWAVATSCIMKRRGVSDDGRPWHHLIDPRTGQPADTNVAAATVLTKNALAAEVLAKSIIIHGVDAGRGEIVKTSGDHALVITTTATLRLTSAMLPLVKRL